MTTVYVQFQDCTLTLKFIKYNSTNRDITTKMRYINFNRYNSKFRFRNI